MANQFGMASKRSKIVPGFVSFSLLWVFLPTASSFNVSSYLSKYQLQPAIEGTKPSIRCLNGGWIAEGLADYSMFPTEDDGTPLLFLQELHRQGFHCECPEGFTGLLCSRPYEFCGGSTSSSNHESATKHVCFNHGKCIDGIEAIYPDQQFCDCSQAIWHGKKFAGKYCEKTYTDLNTCDEKGSYFCVNGECIANGDSDSPSRYACQCDKGWSGDHCEFLSEGKPECNLDCGPGVCQMSYAEYDDPNDYQEYWRHNINHTFCSCPQGYSGTTCEITEEALVSGARSTDICDDSMQRFCINGGVCKANYLQTPAQPCSCPVGFDGP
jgi:hypothetical protein